MHRTILLLMVGLTTAPFAVACDKSGASAQTEVTSAQQNANQQIASANDEANAKSARAQAEADQKIAAVQADFAKTREDYRHEVQDDLDSINEDIATLDAREQTATGRAKVDLDAKLPALHAQRDAFVNDFRALMAAPATTWDSARARVDKEWSDLKTSVRHAS